MDSLFVAINAVLPFVIYMAFGMEVRLAGMADEDLMRRMNQIVFNAFYPVMMFYNLRLQLSGTFCSLHNVCRTRRCRILHYGPEYGL